MKLGKLGKVSDMDKEKENQEQGEVLTEKVPEISPGVIDKTPKATDTEEIPVAESLEEPPISAEVPEADQEEVPGATGAQEKLTEYIIRFFPDADVSTPEKLMESLLPLVEKTVSLHDDLYQVVEEFPEFGDFLLGLRKGYTPQQAMAMYFDVESLTPPEGAEDEEAVMKAKETRKKTVNERKSKLENIEKNKVVSAQNLINIKDELGLDDATTMEVGKMAGEIIQDFMQDGLIKPENWKKLANGLRHEVVVSEKEKEKETAVEDALVKGRNEQIEKKRINKESGDGLPKLASTGSLTPEKKEDQFTTGLKKIANKKSIL